VKPPEHLHVSLATADWMVLHCSAGIPLTFPKLSTSSHDMELKISMFTIAPGSVIVPPTSPQTRQTAFVGDPVGSGVGFRVGNVVGSLVGRDVGSAPIAEVGLGVGKLVGAVCCMTTACTRPDKKKQL
jgi:hypothetical protein